MGTVVGKRKVPARRRKRPNEASDDVTRKGRGRRRVQRDDTLERTTREKMPIPPPKNTRKGEGFEKKEWSVPLSESKNAVACTERGEDFRRANAITGKGERGGR